jgi:hypothetical protein
VYRFFLYFLSRDRAERAAGVLETAGYATWDIRPGWDDPFTRLELRRELPREDLPAAVAWLTERALAFDGEYGSCEAGD